MWGLNLWFGWMKQGGLSSMRVPAATIDLGDILIPVPTWLVEDMQIPYDASMCCSQIILSLSVMTRGCAWI